MSQWSIGWKSVKERSNTKLTNLIAIQIQVSQFSVDWKGLRGGERKREREREREAVPESPISSPHKFKSIKVLLTERPERERSSTRITSLIANQVQISIVSIIVSIDWKGLRERRSTRITNSPITFHFKFKWVNIVLTERAWEREAAPDHRSY